MPDIFSGDPAPHDITFNSTEFLARHTPEVVDPIVNSTIDYLRNTVGVKTLAVTGYCFGGRYAFRFGGESRGTNVVFTAHPSLLEDNEVSGVNAPASIAAAGGYPNPKLEQSVNFLTMPFRDRSIDVT